MKDVALDEERAQNKVWEKKGSLAEGCHYPHLSYSKRSQGENGLFFPGVTISWYFRFTSNRCVHFRRAGTDSPSQKISPEKSTVKIPSAHDF